MEARTSRALIVSINAQVKQGASLEMLPIELGDAGRVVVNGGGIVSGRHEGVAAANGGGILIGNPKTKCAGIGRPQDPGTNRQDGHCRVWAAGGRGSICSPSANFKSVFLHVFNKC